MHIECPEIIKGESAREFATRVIKLNILNLNLSPGQSISENDFSEVLGISRTPIREAFIRLSQDHLIEIYPQKGTNVSKINLDYVEEGWFTRITLEKAIVKLVCENFVDDQVIKELDENLHFQEYYINKKEFLKIMFMDEAFHKILYAACKKERTYNAIESLNFDYYRTRILSLSSIIKMETVFTQHVDIKNAIKDRDSKKAQRAIEIHLNSVKMDKEILKREYPEFLK